MPKLLRLFLSFSLTSIVVATVLLTLLYRQVTIQATDNLAQASSLASARVTLLLLKPELDEYLTTVSGARPNDLAAQRLAAQITAVIREITRTNPSPVVRINVFNRIGTVVFSTDRDQLGQNHVNNTGFQSAISGRVVNNLIYRDIFNRFDTRAESGHLAPNLMETYIPVRASAEGAVDGVFESYTDVSSLVSRNQNATMIVLIGAGLVLLSLCGVLVLLLQRTLKTIESRHLRAADSGRDAIKSQQRSIEERTVALEMLSAKFLSDDEVEKKKLAFGLHQGLTQSLTTAKFRVERYLNQSASDKAPDEPLASVVALLQSAIEEVDTIATRLRPASLDERGLLPTIEWLCRDFEGRNPPITVDEELSAAENDVPAQLKIIIYRIIESVFAGIARHENSDEIRLALRRDSNAVTLAIDDTSRDSRYAPTAGHDVEAELHLRFGEAQERTTLSGGQFTIARNEAGGIRLRASWMV